MRPEHWVICVRCGKQFLEQGNNFAFDPRTQRYTCIDCVNKAAETRRLLAEYEREQDEEANQQIGFYQKVKPFLEKIGFSVTCLAKPHEPTIGCPVFAVGSCGGKDYSFTVAEYTDDCLPGMINARVVITRVEKKDASIVVIFDKDFNDETIDLAKKNNILLLKLESGFLNDLKVTVVNPFLF